MSTSFYRYWIPVSIAFHLILLFMLQVMPVEIQQQSGVLNVISVSWEMADTEKMPPPVMPIITPVDKVEPAKNTDGKYWGKSLTEKGDGKQAETNNGVGETVKKGKTSKLVTATTGTYSVPLVPDNTGPGRNLYGKENNDIGGSVSAAKSGDSGTFYANFSKNEEDFSLRFRITILNGKISKVKQLTISRNDGKDDSVREQIISGIILVNTSCKSDRMNVNVAISNGNLCHYVWE